MSTSMQSIDELFASELRDLLDAERAVEDALQQLSECRTDQQLQQLFRAHLAETRNQIDRLEQVFATIGQQPMPTTCEGVRGIIREHDFFVGKHMPAGHVHTAYDVGAGQKVEQYEITAYEHLVQLAETLGNRQAVQLLQASLSEEREQLQRLRDVTSTAGLSGPVPQSQQPVVTQHQTGGGVDQRQQFQQQPTQQPQQTEMSGGQQPVGRSQHQPTGEGRQPLPPQ